MRQRLEELKAGVARLGYSVEEIEAALRVTPDGDVPSTVEDFQWRLDNYRIFWGLTGLGYPDLVAYRIQKVIPPEHVHETALSWTPPESFERQLTALAIRRLVSAGIDEDHAASLVTARTSAVTVLEIPDDALAGMVAETLHPADPVEDEPPESNAAHVPAESSPDDRLQRLVPQAQSAGHSLMRFLEKVSRGGVDPMELLRDTSFRPGRGSDTRQSEPSEVVSGDGEPNEIYRWVLAREGAREEAQKMLDGLDIVEYPSDHVLRAFLYLAANRDEDALDFYEENPDPDFLTSEEAVEILSQFITGPDEW